MAPRPQVGTDSPPSLGMSCPVGNFAQTVLLPPSLTPHSSCPPLDDNTSTKDVAILPAYSTVDLVNEDPDVADPWDLPDLKDTGVKWSGEAARHHCAHCGHLYRTLIQNFVCFSDRSGYKRKDYESADWYCEGHPAGWTPLLVYLLAGCSQFCFPASRR